MLTVRVILSASSASSLGGDVDVGVAPTRRRFGVPEIIRPLR
jgi:hypothetical protein